MFTGFIKSTGKTVSVAKGGDSAVICIRTDLDLSRSNVGDSIAVNGACLTITKLEGALFYADASFETLERTTLGRLKAGEIVNIEQPLTLNEGLHGHLVLGHVDGVGKVVSIADKGKARALEISAPAALMPYLAPKGSVAVDGVSLTINGTGENSFTLVIVPHTQSKTTLSLKRVGEEVNLEADVIARYLERLITTRGAKADKSEEGLTLDTLRNNGYI